MRTSNPALRPSALTDTQPYRGVGAAHEAMTVQGAVNKTIILLFLLLLSSAYVWRLALPTSSDWGAGGLVPSALISTLLMGGSIGGLVVALVLVFKPVWSAVLAPAYSILQGLAIGGISVMMEARYPGIVLQASFLTMGTLLALLLAYKSGFVQVSERFRAGVVAATGGIAVVYLLAMVLRLFGVNMPFLHDSSPMSIGISAVVIVVAALNLVLDFDFIEQGAARRAPKYMEWYAAFGLLVTLVWLYIEFLKLLSKLNNRK